MGEGTQDRPRSRSKEVSVGRVWAGGLPERGSVAKVFGKGGAPMAGRGNTGGESWVWGKVRVPSRAQAGQGDSKEALGSGALSVDTGVEATDGILVHPRRGVRGPEP